MRMLHDSPTVAFQAWSSAPSPLLTPAAAAAMVDEALEKAAGGLMSERDATRIFADLLIALAALFALPICILSCLLIHCIVSNGRRHTIVTVAAPAPPPPHAAAAAATAAGGPTTDARLRKKKELMRIPVVVYEAKRGASATDCVICLGEFDDGEKVRVLPRCHHDFHAQCIDQWLAKRPSCPTCRDSLSRSSLLQQGSDDAGDGEATTLVGEET